jgi:hypothetical protein
MALVYEETEIRRGGFSIHNMDPHKHYLRHYNNLLYLTFIQQRGTLLERFQATKELKICERKLKFWSHHPEFKLATVEPELIKAKGLWQDSK